jgi:hypothetical protein
LALGYGNNQRSRKKRKNVNCRRHSDFYWVKVIIKRWSEVKGRNSLNEEIEDDRSVRKKDHGQLSKRKKPSFDALEHQREGRKDKLAKP